MVDITVYVLKLENNKYYVGKTRDFEKRYTKHMNGLASSWTRFHKPQSCILRICPSEPFDEDKYTKQYMTMYGIENVRGGAYANPVLCDMQIYALIAEIRAEKDLCIICGSKDHFFESCNYFMTKKKTHSF